LPPLLSRCRFSPFSLHYAAAVSAAMLLLIAVAASRYQMPMLMPPAPPLPFALFRACIRAACRRIAHFRQPLYAEAASRFSAEEPPPLFAAAAAELFSFHAGITLFIVYYDCFSI
jgi:hypothetical protein